MTVLGNGGTVSASRILVLEWKNLNMIVLHVWHVLKDWLSLDSLELGLEGLSAMSGSGRVAAATSISHVGWDVNHFSTWMAPLDVVSFEFTFR
jgi:hypothetical protein